MSTASRARSWWKALFNRQSAESDVETELAFHIESYSADLMRNGVAREEALRRAKAELGSVAAQKDEWRASIGLRAWDDLRADARYAFRQLRGAPGFAATVVVVLALGIGVNAAMFSIVDATLLRWLPYEQQDRLVTLATRDKTGAPGWVFHADLVEWRNQSHTLESIGCYAKVEGFLETAQGQFEVSAHQVSPNIFAVLRRQPAMGRAFLSEEEVPGRSRVMVVSDSVWRTMLRSDPEIAGKTVKLNEQIYTVIGVMPKGFIFPANENAPQVWLPLEMTPSLDKRDFSAGEYKAIGRMRKGETPASVRSDLSGIQERLGPLYQGNMEGLGPVQVEAKPYRDSLVQDSRPAVLALLAAVATVWLIACANVANLMLARGMARQREIALRSALGASKLRIVRQLFTESMVLSLAGAAAGTALAQVALSVFRKVLSQKLGMPEALAPSAAVLGALLALSMASAILFGLLPAWLAARTPLELALRQGSMQSGAGRSRNRAQKATMVAEIGLSLVLLVACGLLLRTVYALRRVPLGFRTDHVLMMQPKLPRYKYRGVDANRAVYQPLLQRIQQMGGVDSAALTTIVPLQKGFSSTISLYVGANKDTNQPSNRIDAQLRAAGPELQDVLGFRMYRGRYFNQQDTPDGQPVAVVNRAFAKMYAPAGDIMQGFQINLAKDRPVKIVGIIDDMHQAAIDQPSVPELDFCAPQLRPTDGFYQPTLQAHIEIAIRTRRDPASFIPDLRRAMLDVNPDLQYSSFATMDQVVEDSMGSQLLAAHLLELFAGAALLVALAGLYGLLSYLVAQRRQELGVRLALGAQRGNIIQLILKQAGWMLLAGAVVGVVLAYFSGRMLAAFLYGVKPGDAWTMLAVSAVLFLSGMVAAYIPARRAAHVDPLEALRGE